MAMRMDNSCCCRKNKNILYIIRLMPSWTYYALIIRVLVALCTRTFFQPDEYFQSLEPAHHLVFGYGHLTWEWLSPRPIRSIIYPALNVPIYWLLKITGLSESVIGDWLLVSDFFVEKAKLRLHNGSDFMPKNPSRSVSGRYRYLACQTLVHCVG